MVFRSNNFLKESDHVKHETFRNYTSVYGLITSAMMHEVGFLELELQITKTISLQWKYNTRVVCTYGAMIS